MENKTMANVVNGKNGASHPVLSTSQRAGMVAVITLGEHKPSIAELAALCGTNVTYVSQARAATPRQRQALITGMIDIAGLRVLPRLPAPIPDDTALADYVRKLGIDHWLKIADAAGL
jgi:hypothetical protein